MKIKKIALLFATTGAGLVGTPTLASAASNPDAAVITVPCGVMNAVDKKGHPDLSARMSCAAVHADGDADDGNTVDLYSGGVLVYSETNAPLFVHDSSAKGGPGQVSVTLTGNGSHFNGWYVDAATSWLTAPDLNVKISQRSHSKKATNVVLWQHYAPVGSAIWSLHSEDGANAQAGIDLEKNRAMAAEAQLSVDLAAERAARIAGDQALTGAISTEAASRATADANLQTAIGAETARATAAEGMLSGDLAAEVARATAAEGALSADAAAEVAARKQGDTDTLAAANAYTDAAVAGEMARAVGAEAAIVAAANAHEAADAAARAAEAAARQAGDAALQMAVDAEAAARAAADANLQNGINAANAANAAETARALAAEAGLGAALGAEAASRMAGEAMLVAALNAEAATRQADDAALANSIAAEAAARAAGDAATLAAANAYTDSRTPWPQSCPVGQEIVSMGNGTWACAADSSGLPQGCIQGEIAVAAGNDQWVCGASCGGVVKFTRTDPNNCGACGNVCVLPNANAGCAGGACTVASCIGNFQDCDAQAGNGCEIDGGIDINNCGGCGNQCQNNAPLCQGGACVACPGNRANCNNQVNDGCEVDLQADANNCGGCGVVCPNNAPNCVGGVCGNLIACNVQKVYTNITPMNLPSECSGTGNFPYNSCNGAYGFQWTDATGGGVTSATLEFTQGLNCDAQGNRPTTLNGQAGPTFNEVSNSCACQPPGQGITSLALPLNAYALNGVNTLLIANVGGSCEGIAKFGGGLIARITTTFAANNINPGTDANNCGGCNNVCAGSPNAQPTCQGGQCVFGACLQGFANCNNNGADGCEVNTNSDSNNCGGCGVVCPNNAPTCSGGVCTNLYSPVGVQLNIPVANLAGWSQCYKDTYNVDLPTAQVLQQCAKAKLMMACRPANNANLSVLAWAPRADVIFETGQSNAPHIANNVGWYFNNAWSWGFVAPGDALSRNSCDTAGGNNKICWHTGQNVGGYRCGGTTGLNNDAGWDRIVYQAD